MKIFGIVFFSMLLFVEPSSAQLSVTLEKDKAYELVLFSVKEGKFEQLLNDYLPKVLPLVGEYGGKPLASFSVVSSSGMDQSPQIVALWEWTNPNAFNLASNDMRIQEILPIRNDAMAFIEEANFFSVSETTTLDLTKEESYVLLVGSKIKKSSAESLLRLHKAKKADNPLTWKKLVLARQSEESSSEKVEAEFILKAIIQ